MRYVQAALLNGIGRALGFVGLDPGGPFRPAGCFKAVIGVQIILVVQKEQRGAVGLGRQGVSDGVIAQQPVHVFRAQLGKQVAFLKGFDAAVGMVFNGFLIGDENHLVGIDDIFRQQQSLAVPHAQHAPQHRLHSAVLFIGIFAKINVIIPLSFHIPLDFRLGGKEQKQKQRSSD